MKTVSRLAYPFEIVNRVGVMIKKNNMGTYALGRHQWNKISEQGSDPANGPMDHVQHIYRSIIHFGSRRKNRWIQSERAFGKKMSH